MPVRLLPNAADGPLRTRRRRSKRSDCSWRETARLRVTHDLQQPSNHRACDRVGERGDAIVPAALVVGTRAALLDLDDSRPRPALCHAHDEPLARLRPVADAVLLRPLPSPARPHSLGCAKGRRTAVAGVHERALTSQLPRRRRHGDQDARLGRVNRERGQPGRLRRAGSHRRHRGHRQRSNRLAPSCRQSSRGSRATILEQLTQSIPLHGTFPVTLPW